jgi:ABC-type dipeptide/oligopeptide/nickel transport system ATPase subunit
MSDKNFKVKSGLNIPIASASILTTDASGNVSSSATLAVAAGGTGQTSTANALNALLPLQTGNENYFLQTNAVSSQWSKVYNQIFKNSGSTVNPRGTVNFIGAAFTDSSGTDTTTITIGGGNAETYALMGVF